MKYTDKEVIDQVKSWNFGFICVNPNAGISKVILSDPKGKYKNSISIEDLESKLKDSLDLRHKQF